MRLYNILKNIATDIKALLPSLKVNDASIKETLTPIIPTFLNFTNSLNRTCYFKKGTKVCIYFFVTGITSRSAIFTLPIGYRPYNNIYFKIVGDSPNKTITLEIVASSGNVIVVDYEDAGAFGYFEFDAFN